MDKQAIRAVGWDMRPIGEPMPVVVCDVAVSDPTPDTIAKQMRRHGLRSAEVRITYTLQTARDIVDQAWRSYPEARYIFVSRDVYDELLYKTAHALTMLLGFEPVQHNGAEVKLCPDLPPGTAVAGV